MSTIQEIWRSKMIPEGPMVVRRELPQDVKDKLYAMLDTMWADDPECAYNVAAGEAQDFVPISHDAYLGIVAARKLQEGM
jgi:phosphonate transport system substrate-binding protein